MWTVSYGIFQLLFEVFTQFKQTLKKKGGKQKNMQTYSPTQSYDLQ